MNRIPGVLLWSWLASAGTFHAAELVVGNDFALTKEAILKSWTVVPDEVPRISLGHDGATPFISLTSQAPASALMRQEITVPPETTTLTLVTKVRTTHVVRGEKPWQVPRVVILWKGDAGNAHQFPVNYPKDMSWTLQRHTVVVPKEFRTFTLWVGIPNAGATMDVAEVSIKPD